MGFTTTTTLTRCLCSFSVVYLVVSDTGNGTVRWIFLYGHGVSTLADTYGRELPLSQMKDALEKGVEGKRPVSSPFSTQVTKLPLKQNALQHHAEALTGSCGHTSIRKEPFLIGLRRLPI